MTKFFEVVNKVTSLYVTYRGRYVVAINGKVFIPHKDGFPKKLDNRALINHVNQRYALGVFSAEHGSKFICFDVDLPDKDIVRKVIHGLCEFGFPKDRIYVSYSGGKGFHVEVFFTDLVYLNDLRNLYLWVIKKENLDSQKVEFRPTFGQAIKLPLSVHHKTGNVCWYLNTDTLEPIKDIGYVTQIVQMDRDEVEKMIHDKIVPSDLAQEMKSKHLSERSPSCTSYCEGDNMTGAGMRHEMMKAMALRERYKDTPQEVIEEKLIKWAEAQNPDFITDPWNYVVKDAESLAAFVWSEKFKKYSREIFIAANDLETLLSLRGMYKKKLLFLLILFYRKFGVVRMSHERMAEYVGASRSGIINALNALEEEVGCIAAKPGTSYRVDGLVHRTSNEYVYKPKAFDPWGDKFSVDWDFKKETFNQVYLKMIRDNVPQDEWKKHFTKKEMEELQNADNN